MQYTCNIVVKLKKNSNALSKCIKNFYHHISVTLDTEAFKIACNELSGITYELHNAARPISTSIACCYIRCTRLKYDKGMHVKSNSCY